MNIKYHYWDSKQDTCIWRKGIPIYIIVPKLIMADFLMHEAQQPIIVIIFIMQSSYFLKDLAQI